MESQRPLETGGEWDEDAEGDVWRHKDQLRLEVNETRMLRGTCGVTKTNIDRR